MPKLPAPPRSSLDVSKVCKPPPQRNDAQETPPRAALSHWIRSETTEHRTFLCMEVGSLSRTLVPPWDWYDTVMLKKSVPWRERKPMFSCCSWRVVNERYTYLTMVIFESYTSSLTPITNIGASADGAVMMTFLQPPSMCSLAFSSVVKTPVDSITYSTPTLPQGILFGSFLSLTQTRTGHSRENV